MSAPSQIRPDAKSVKALAASWLERRDREDWTASEQAELDAWLETSTAHSVAFWRLEGTWQRTERLSALREPMRVSHRAPRPRRTTAWFAAAGIVAALGIFGVRIFAEPGERTYSTALGGHEIITLRDGTSIELNTDTSLRVAMNANARNITLDKGEAYFQVVHDPSHLFVVHVGTHRVTDIGTKFLLRKDARQIELALYEGAARFESSDAKSRGAVLRPGDVAIAASNRPGFRMVRNEPAGALVNKLAWQRGFLVMDHTTLAEAARNLNRYNRQKIVVADPSAAAMEMYGTIPINGVNGFIRVAQSVFGLHVNRRGDEIVISK